MIKTTPKHAASNATRTRGALKELDSADLDLAVGGAGLVCGKGWFGGISCTYYPGAGPYATAGSSDGGSSASGASDGGASDGGSSDGGASDGGASDGGSSDGGWGGADGGW